ncbi:hypothetical protein KQ693_05810 [Thermus sp. PS18]|uniref:hypothetical protein n=1 Tax=Thermus sp. PS18 TaxID=2849039 RepID=UPI00226491BF|nr:hypothetical protein [Thermus sp. PS18]UZX16544.1 hypothetical protein KQ693_05810 [Thermus sp. PS18]
MPNADRARDALAALLQLLYEYAPPHTWEELEACQRDILEVIRGYEEATRSLEAALARERVLRERESAMERALLLIQEEARRARRC